MKLFIEQSSPASCHNIPLLILIFSSHPHVDLPRGLFPPGFPNKILYALRNFLMGSTCSAHLTLTDLVIIIVRGCIQKFPDWPPAARNANGTVLCH